MKKIITILFFVTRLYGQWIFVPSPTTSTLNDVCFINDETGFCTGNNSVILKTTDFGSSWSLLQSLSEGETILTLSFLNQITGYAAGVNAKFFKTTNGGNNWDSIPRLGGYTLRSLYFVDSYTGYVVGYIGSAYKTTNSGNNWEVLNTGSSTIYNSVFFTSDDTGYIGGYTGIIKTSDGGANWSSQNVNTDIRSIYFINNSSGFATGLSGNIYKTTNAGGNWIPVPSGTSQLLNSIYFPESNIGYCAGDMGVILKTTNGGDDWQLQTTSFYSWTSIYFRDSLNGICIGLGGVIIKTTTGGGELVTSLNNNNIYSYHFSLSQNYPNPFNPVTRIKYDVPPNVKSQTSNVKLIIYDVLGREIETLVNESQKPGSYEVQWDGSRYASGVYFYKLMTDKDIETRKMVLIK